MEKYLNFKKIEVSAVNKDEAKAMAPFGIQGDATQAWKNAKAKADNGVWTDAIEKEFCAEYLEKKTKNVPGSGFIIVKEAAVVDKRDRPYKKKNIKNEDGKREWDTNIQIIGKKSGTLYATVTLADAKKFSKTPEDVKRVKKSDADKVVKTLYTGEKSITEGVILKYVKETRKPSQAIAAEYEYTPTKGTKNGTYVLFGIEA